MMLILKQFTPYMNEYQLLANADMYTFIVPIAQLKRILADKGHSKRSANEWIRRHTVKYSTSERAI